MIRKALFTLLMLTGIGLLASCSPSRTSPTPKPDMPNPASVYCQQNGGTLELRKDASGGVAGVCVFPDGSECDEWAYYRHECKPGDSLATSEPAILPATASPSPALKPAALRITYFNNGSVMQWTEGQGSSMLAQASADQLRISDDGQLVAYLGSNASGDLGISVVNTDGTGQRLLVSSDYLQNLQPAGQVVSFDFAPGSHTLYFVTDRYDLHRVSADGSASPAPVFEAGKGGFFSFSPDGQWMTLYHPNELVLAHPEGTAARVAFQYPEDFQYTMMGPQIIWEPDSSGFHLASASGPQGSPDSMTVWFIPVSGDPVKQMSYAGPYEANLSPDGLKVVYLNYQNEPVDVHVVSEDGQDTTYNSFSNPPPKFMGWAPDAQRFLLSLSNDARFDDPHLCVLGQQPVKLTDSDYANSVAWVDAQRFLFISAGALRLQQEGKPSILVDNVQSSSYDYTSINP